MNDHTIKDSFEFVSGTIQQDSCLFMASLDIDLLFANSPLDETVNIYIELLLQEENIVSGLNKKQMLEMLSITLKK